MNLYKVRIILGETSDTEDMHVVADSYANAYERFSTFDVDVLSIELVERDVLMQEEK